MAPWRWGPGCARPLLPCRGGAGRRRPRIGFGHCGGGGHPRTGFDLGPAPHRRRPLPVREYASGRVDGLRCRPRGAETSTGGTVSRPLLRRRRSLSRRRRLQPPASCRRAVPARVHHPWSGLQSGGAVRSRRGFGRGSPERPASSGRDPREGCAGSRQASGPWPRHRDRCVRRGRVPRSRCRLRSEHRSSRSGRHRSALGHCRRVLPLPGQVPVQAPPRVRRHVRRSRVPQGQDQGRRVLRADGGVLRLGRGLRAGCGRRRRRGRRRRHVPGLRGGGPVLPPDHQDRLVAAAHRRRGYGRGRGVRRTRRAGPCGVGG